MRWLKSWADEGWTLEAALEAFNRLPPVAPGEMIGTWHGSELPTGHPLDGLLAFYGWRGKRFLGADAVDPLLFDRGRKVLAVHPGRLPIGLALALPRAVRTEAARGLFRLLLPLIATRSPKARLRIVQQGGQMSAALIYDDQPIIDHFRRVDATQVLGMMDLRPVPRPFFFLLTKKASAPVS